MDLEQKLALVDSVQNYQFSISWTEKLARDLTLPALWEGFRRIKNHRNKGQQ
jgi:hypothetical protein